MSYKMNWLLSFIYLLDCKETGHEDVILFSLPQVFAF